MSLRRVRVNYGVFFFFHGFVEKTMSLKITAPLVFKSTTFHSKACARDVRRERDGCNFVTGHSNGGRRGKKDAFYGSVVDFEDALVNRLSLDRGAEVRSIFPFSKKGFLDVRPVFDGAFNGPTLNGLAGTFHSKSHWTAVK